MCVWLFGDLHYYFDNFQTVLSKTRHTLQLGQGLRGQQPREVCVHVCVCVYVINFSSSYLQVVLTWTLTHIGVCVCVCVCVCVFASVHDCMRGCICIICLCQFTGCCFVFVGKSTERIEVWPLSPLKSLFMLCFFLSEYHFP